ncbi:MAG TPA: response regulator [Chthoniobacterales bacterium]|nr:response regulator [Chthoniobacterales bacterium]
MAELLKSKAPNDETAQRITDAARALLDVISQHSAEQRDDGAPSPSTDKCDVLYIEDDRRTFGSVKLLLEVQRELKVLQAANGETGVALAQCCSPKLILLDLDLPDIHGSEVIQRLQKETSTSHIPVIVVSGDATPSQIERLLILGARNYLTKPIRVQPFLAVIDEVLPPKVH